VRVVSQPSALLSVATINDFGADEPAVGATIRLGYDPDALVAMGSGKDLPVPNDGLLHGHCSGLSALDTPCDRVAQDAADVTACAGRADASSKWEYPVPEPTLEPP
jgi:hypothetical protein